MATPIPIEWQTPAVLLDEGRLAQCSRFYVDVNTHGEKLSLVILVDDQEYAVVAKVTTVDREVVEVAYQVSGRRFSIRLTGSLTIGQPNFYGAWTDLDLEKSTKLLANNFDNRLWLTSGRDAMPQGTMRRCVGAAPELNGSVYSRWGSELLYNINAISVYKWNNVRYAYDGSSMYANGVSIQSAINAATGASGFTGGRLTFVEAPPQEGLEDYLFVLGGGIPPFKIAPDGTVTLWGIQAPGNGATAQAGDPDQIVIDNMTSDGTTNWATHHTNLAFDSSAADTFLAGGCYELSGITDGPWWIQQEYGSTQDWSEYAGGTISLQSDLVSLYAQINPPNQIVWMWILVDVDDGSFKKNFYKLVIQLVATTDNVHAAGADAIIVADAGRWVQLAAAKSQFQRVGTNLNLDWSNVQAVRIEGGALIDNPGKIFLNGFQIYGGFPLGIGPAALLGGSIYQYAVTFGNSVTGSDSNPNGMQVQPDGTVNPPTPFLAQGCALGPNGLANIPVSTDPQVSNRKLWRTTAGGALFSYLDTIPDNTTTTYTDVTGDLPGQPIITTPWTKNLTGSPGSENAAPTAGYKIDGGNGFWFECSTGGNTGATIPAWNIPTGPFLGDWVPWLTYSAGDWINYQGTGYYCILESLGNLPTDATYFTALGTTTDTAGSSPAVWAWGGLNAVRTLGLSDNLLYDNQQPLESYGDVAGPWEGSLFWDQDSTTGRKGYIYASPPGRPESVGTFFVATGDDDPTQKVVIWDDLPWWLSTKKVGPIGGEYPALEADELKGGLGTSWPYTVVAAQNGIYYRGPDGLRMIDRAGSVLVAFQAIGNILRGRTSENVAPFYPVWGALTRNEIWWGDDTVTFGIGGQSPTNLLQAPIYVVRMLGQPILCAFYEKDDDEILGSFGGNVLLIEHEGALDDG